MNGIAFEGDVFNPQELEGHPNDLHQPDSQKNRYQRHLQILFLDHQSRCGMIDCLHRLPPAQIIVLMYAHDTHPPFSARLSKDKSVVIHRIIWIEYIHENFSYRVDLGCHVMRKEQRISTKNRAGYGSVSRWRCYDVQLRTYYAVWAYLW